MLAQGTNCIARTMEQQFGQSHPGPVCGVAATVPRTRVLMMMMWSERAYRQCSRERITTVEVAASGEEALRVMGATHCDILLTDWQMPNMDGISLCRRVRREYQEDSVYVLLLTVRDTEEDRLAGICRGRRDD